MTQTNEQYFRNSFRCYKCLGDFPAEAFHKNSTHRGVNGYCKSCMSSYSKIWCKNNKEKTKASYHRNKSKPENKLKSLLSTTNIDRSLLDFEWAWGQLEKQNFKCEITKEPFTWGSKEPTCLSIDRIDPNQGYTKENVRFVCWWINAAMGNWGLDHIKDLIMKWQNNGRF